MTYKNKKLFKELRTYYKDTTNHKSILKKDVKLILKIRKHLKGNYSKLSIFAILNLLEKGLPRCSYCSKTLSMSRYCGVSSNHKIISKTFFL